MNDRPANILLLMFDQLKASACPMHGHPQASLPFVEEMASRGVTFTNAYANSPICTPSRTSIMTGVHPLVHQVTCHQNRVPCNLPQIAELLGAAGYYSTAAGHVEECRNLVRGFHDVAPSTELGALNTAYRTRLMSGRADVGWSAGALDYDTPSSHAKVMTDRVLYQADGIGPTNRPFFMHVAYEEPHPPYFVCRPYDAMFDPASLDLPPRGSDDELPAWQARVREQLGSDLATEEDVRRVESIYLGMTAHADHQMRRVVDGLAERGVLDNTWIIITSDHGDYTGEKGLFTKSESLYECLLHVPLVIVPPDGVDWPRGTTVDGFVELLDLFPSILSMAGVDVPDYAQGHDLVEWVRQGATSPLRDAVFAQVGDYHGSLKTTMPGGMPESGRHPSLLRGVRTAEFAYTNDPDYGDEAYDLTADPHELRNLLQADSSVPDGVQQLRGRLNNFTAECITLRERFGVVAGYRGFDLEGLVQDLYPLHSGKRPDAD